ncbi:MAG: NUDIX hydrolase [Lachnospiraceae bacterium]|nr:NUDIX hydrolase [Lachnospiraceae bacterium]
MPLERKIAGDAHGWKNDADQEETFGKEDEQEMSRDGKNDADLAWELVSCENIVEDEWINFRKCEYRFPDGSIYGPFYTYSRRDYAVVVATDTDGRYICVRQFRQGIGRVTTEFVAGGIERSGGRQYGTAPVEDTLEAAKRELSEETGYESDEWRKLLVVPSNATIADNYAYIYEARNCVRKSGQSLDETEFLNVEKYTKEEIRSLIDEGEFPQAMHILAFHESLAGRP